MMVNFPLALHLPVPPVPVAAVDLSPSPVFVLSCVSDGPSVRDTAGKKERKKKNKNKNKKEKKDSTASVARCTLRFTCTSLSSRSSFRVSRSQVSGVRGAAFAGPGCYAVAPRSSPGLDARPGALRQGAGGGTSRPLPGPPQRFRGTRLQGRAAAGQSGRADPASQARPANQAKNWKPSREPRVSLPQFARSAVPVSST